MANALELSGRHQEAIELFERLLTLRNDVGLLSEEYDPRYGRLVGNMPQAFSHVPLVQTALNLSGHAEEHRRGVTGTSAGACQAKNEPRPRHAIGNPDCQAIMPSAHILIVNSRSVHQPVFVVGAPHSGADLIGRALKASKAFTSPSASPACCAWCMPSPGGRPCTTAGRKPLPP